MKIYEVCLIVFFILFIVGFIQVGNSQLRKFSNEIIKNQKEYEVKVINEIKQIKQEMNKPF